MVRLSWSTRSIVQSLRWVTGFPLSVRNSGGIACAFANNRLATAAKTTALFLNIAQRRLKLHGSLLPSLVEQTFRLINRIIQFMNRVRVNGALQRQRFGICN